MNTGDEKPFSPRLRIAWRIIFVAIAVIPSLVMAFFWIQSRTVAHVWHFHFPAGKGSDVSIFSLDGCFRIIADSGHALNIEGTDIKHGYSVVPGVLENWPWGYFKVEVSQPSPAGPAGGLFMSLPFWLLEVLWICGVIAIAVLMRRRRRRMTGESG